VILDAITIVGPGRMGLTLGSALEQSGEVARLTFFGRQPDPPSHPLFIESRAKYVFGVEPLARDTSAVFLAVPDHVIPEMAFTLAAHGPAPEGCAAFHLSATLPTDVLAPLHEQGYGVGSFHPLVSVPERSTETDRLTGAHCAVTGSAETIATARRVTAAIGADLVTVPAARRPLFHAAVVLAAGYLPPVLGLSARLMDRAGVAGDETLPALLSVIRDVARTVETGGLAAALPAPLARGDVETIALHLRALDPEDQRLYAVLGREMLRLAGEGVDADTRESLEELYGRYLELETTGTGY
jgi:predicted short-subunit dehydrogenase-like oxidoreductase (DUF2520 family)